ncbi:glycosyltransferase family 4 protein [Stutzerimonas stutzeri]|uniref:glycosyltransferase family 4 protein n=1 Tax=Stutzerimonas stutzeri TaxID=316 RepID=UPI00031BDAC7|nr:glycosyltransferase family 4 protein [Stutzerimonas stutzeri]
MRKVVLFTTKYLDGVKDFWLTNELASELSRSGSDVTVIALSWLMDDPPSSVSEVDGIKVIRIKAPTFLYRRSKILTAFKLFLFPIIVRSALRRYVSQCDLFIANTPCVTLLGLPSYFKRNHKSYNYLVLWDFFPFYLRDLGLMKNRLVFKFFHYLENFDYKCFDRIGCMTMGNVKFLEENYSGVQGKSEILPLWTAVKPVVAVDKNLVRESFGLPCDKFIAVYGGAMSVVQELDNLLALAGAFRDSDVVFLFIGKGTERTRLEEQARQRGLSNTFFMDYIPRDQYEPLIASCDVGLISLAKDLSVPSFPSKSIDYFKVSIPILASLDSTTDFGRILEDEIGAGFSAVAGDTDLLASKLTIMVQDAELRRRMGKAGRNYYESTLSVVSAAEKITESMRSGA